MIIQSGLRAKKSVRAIARSLRRDYRVIQKEVHRNTVLNRPYTAELAQRLADERERKRNRSKLEKLEYAQVRKHIIEHLKEDESPEQIAGTLKKQPNTELDGKYVCHETIYQYIYAGEGRYEKLWSHLRKGKKKRQKRHARKAQKSHIPDRISIHDRSNEINEKTVPWNWETDTIEGNHTTKGNLSVQYERTTQLVRIHKVKNKSAEETEDAIRKSIDSLPIACWQSITFDNGGEGANHVALKNDYNLKTYFCDAYASWQKGGVENMNGLIRQYIPKGSDISLLTEKQIHDIQERLNNRPRKSLNFLSPNQVLASRWGIRT